MLMLLPRNKMIRKAASNHLCNNPVDRVCRVDGSPLGGSSLHQNAANELLPGEI
jgi:hypothetical protein